jgi:ABC-type glycerol-3-phosphate transport system permease component
VWSNYATILESAIFWQAVQNSAIIAVVATALATALGSMALPEAAFSLPVTIVILRPFMRAIPGELEDAATVDGATRIRFFVRILLPLSRRALITVGILAFVTSWNTYLLPLIVLSTPSHFTLPLAVAMFQSQYSTDTAGLRLYRAVHASRPVHLRFRAALPRRRPGRRDQGLSTIRRDKPGRDRPAVGRGPGRSPAVRDRYRPAPLGTRCGAPAASRRSCWSSV